MNKIAHPKYRFGYQRTDSKKYARIAEVKSNIARIRENKDYMDRPELLEQVIYQMELLQELMQDENYLQKAMIMWKNFLGGQHKEEIAPVNPLNDATNIIRPFKRTSVLAAANCTKDLLEF